MEGSDRSSPIDRSRRDLEGRLLDVKARADRSIKKIEWAQSRWRMMPLAVGVVGYRSRGPQLPAAGYIPCPLSLHASLQVTLFPLFVQTNTHFLFVHFSLLFESPPLQSSCLSHNRIPHLLVLPTAGSPPPFFCCHLPLVPPPVISPTTLSHLPVLQVPRLGQRVVVEELGDEVHMREEHPAAAVALQAHLVQSHAGMWGLS